MSKPRPSQMFYAAQMKLFTLLYNTMTIYLYFLIIFNSTVLMQWSLVLVCYVLSTGRFPRVYSHVGEKLISSLLISAHVFL